MKESEPKSYSLRNKIKLFYIKNQLLIDAVTLTTLSSIIVYTSIKCNDYSSENSQLKNELELGKVTHNLDVLERDNQISELVELCSLKDEAHLALAADALRCGSSLGGSELNGYKNFTKNR